MRKRREGDEKVGQVGNVGNLSYFVLAVCVFLFAPTLARAQSSTPREETWVTNGTVRAIARTADTVYIGGEFTNVGPCTSGVPLDATTGQPAATFLRVNNDVFACVADGSGGWYIGGDFTQVGGVARNRIAHILANGSVDLAWNPNANNRVYALAVSGTTVYAGGWFSSIGGQTRNRIAALDAATGNATAWNPNANSSVNALAVSGTTVYAGGSFTGIGGQWRSRIAALDAATGNATGWNPNASGGSNPMVSALAVSGTTVYVGGWFSSIGGQTRNNIAALDAATGNVTAWNPNASGGLDPMVYALAVSGTSVYAGGDFTTIGGQTRNNIAALSAATGNATAWNPNASGGASGDWVSALAVSGTTVYVGGRFSGIGGQPRNNIAALNAATGNATAWNPNANGAVLALAVSGTTVYAGGEFTYICAVTRNRIAALDVATGSVTAWNPNASGFIVYALAVSGTTVYVGGAFGIIGGQMRYNIAALDAATGNATAWNPNASGGGPYVSALAVSGTTVYVGGRFTSIGGQTRNNIAALDAATGSATAWNPNANDRVETLAMSGATVYAGGYFTSIGGQTRRRIAALDAATGNATAWNPNAGQYAFEWVRALAVSGTTIYAGGTFMSIGGQTRNWIAALDATTGNATAWNPNAGGGSSEGVEALAVSGTTVYAGGGFTSIGGQDRRSIAALDAATGNATAWSPNAVNAFGITEVHALAVSGTTVYAGGDFAYIGGQLRPYFAQFDAPTSIGSLRVTIVPQEAIDAGVQWRLTSGPDTGWKNSGVTVSGIPTGNYTVEFKDVPGWTKPANQSVTINESTTMNATGTYVQWSLRVTHWGVYE